MKEYLKSFFSDFGYNAYDADFLLDSYGRITADEWMLFPLAVAGLPWNIGQTAVGMVLSMAVFRAMNYSAGNR